MTTKEIKEILAGKLQDEGWIGEIEDLMGLIKVKTDKDATWITIKDYEHITYKMTQESDDYFGKIVQIYEYWKLGDKLEMGDCITFIDSKREYRIREALIHLGYHIGTTY